MCWELLLSFGGGEPILGCIRAGKRGMISEASLLMLQALDTVPLLRIEAG